MVFKQWPPLNVLRGFEAAARLGSFHQAAQELHLTQSAISQQIRSLEELLGQPLFHRQGRSVTLTDAGQDLLETTQSVLLQLAMGIQRLEQYRKPNQLVLNTSTTLARHWLLPRLGAFHRAHPEVDLWLFTSDEEPDMAEQTIDLALRWELAPPGRVSPPAAAGRPPAAGGRPRRAGVSCGRAHHPARGAGAGLAPLDPQGRGRSAAADPGAQLLRSRPLAGRCLPGTRRRPGKRAALPSCPSAGAAVAALHPQGQGTAVASAGASGERGHAGVPRLLSLACVAVCRPCSRRGWFAIPLR